MLYHLVLKNDVVYGLDWPRGGNSCKAKIQIKTNYWTTECLIKDCKSMGLCLWMHRFAIIETVVYIQLQWNCSWIYTGQVWPRSASVYKNLRHL